MTCASISARIGCWNTWATRRQAVHSLQTALGLLVLIVHFLSRLIVQSKVLNDVEEFDDNADMLIDGLGDARMSSRGTTRIEGEYLDGVESHKIPDHTMFLRTIARPHIRPVLIVEVKRFTFLRTRRATVVDDLDYDTFDEDVEIRATGVIKSTIKQLKQQLARVYLGSSDPI